MRDYPHDPDWEHIERQYERKVEGVQQMRGMLPDQRFVGDPYWVGQFVQTAGWAVGYGWALGRPIDELREVLRPAIEGLHAGLDAGIEPDSFAVGYPLMVSIIAGDREGARQTARLRRQLPVEGPPNDTFDHSQLGLAAFALDDLDGAREHADTVASHLDRVETPPDLAEAYEGFDRMAVAILDGDQAGLDEPAADRAAVKARMYGGDIEARRKIHGVFDFPGVALCRFAHAAGMDLPDQPIYAADLIRHL